ncbi:MAG TPA: transaldolase family protein, partial [Candidatus Dormibacteraeota bacterium]
MSDLRIKIFADGADEKAIAELATNPLIKGFTTNPTLMRAAGVSDYVAFAHRVLKVVTEAPISFEVFDDGWDGMERQARKITTWGKNVFVKIPITNTHGESSVQVMSRLAADGIRLNITGMTTVDQVRKSTEALAGGPECIISVFAGR